VGIGSEMVGRMRTFLRYCITSFLKKVGKRMKNPSLKNEDKDFIMLLRISEGVYDTL
jgi:hypothetical protein